MTFGQRTKRFLYVDRWRLTRVMMLFQRVKLCRVCLG